MDATALSLDAQLAAEREKKTALETQMRELEAAAQEALDEAKLSNEALNEAKTDLELCKLDLEAAQLEIDERAHAEETKVAQLEAQLRDAQTSATEEERTTLRARVAELEAEQRMADELDELHGHEVDALRNDKEQLQELLKKAEADAVELGRAASCLAAERDEREEANSALKARVFDLESDLKALRRDHKNLRRESSSMQRRIGDPQALRLAEQRFDSSRVDAFAAEARLLACRAAVEEEDVDIVAQATQDVARGVLLAKARVVLAESPQRAFAYYARGASQTSSDDDIGEALASLETLRPLSVKDSDDVVAAAFASANAVAHLCVDIRGQNDSAARNILRELDLWRDEAPNDRGDAAKAAQLAIQVAPAAQAFVEKLIEAAPADDVDATELVEALRAVALAAGATLAKAARTDDYAETLAAASNAFASRKGVLGAVAAAKKRREERAALREAAFEEAAAREDAAQAAAAAAGARRDAALRARRGADERCDAAERRVAALTEALATRDAAAPAAPPSPPPASLAQQFFALAGVTDAPPPPPPAPRDDAFAAAAVDALLPPLPAKPAPPRHAAQLEALARRLENIGRDVAGGAPIPPSAAAFLGIRAEAEALLVVR
ncbi:unnamed protein product [Pelagomonas calceolata]|uniref:Uncharacterized protein n=1 Tax=Pelagomonas calceolata TaxID=35677 RepID=A0A8J2X4U5_9STRA|nr:unnamed protein product [Pelagomonas calceolata]